MHRSQTNARSSPICQRVEKRKMSRPFPGMTAKTLCPFLAGLAHNTTPEVDPSLEQLDSDCTRSEN